MTHITVLGGTGYAGSAIVSEAAARGHDVVAVSRHAPSVPVAGAVYATGDVTDATFLKSLTCDTHVLVMALAPRQEMQGRVLEVAQTLIPLGLEAGIRIGVVGGAASLRTSEDGPELIKTDDFPEGFIAEAQEMIEVYTKLLGANESLDWFYVSPAAGFGAHNPGQRTGHYRLGGDVLLTDQQGNSDLSAADLAIAIVNEIESPQHRCVRFSVAY